VCAHLPFGARLARSRTVSAYRASRLQSPRSDGLSSADIRGAQTTFSDSIRTARPESVERRLRSAAYSPYGPKTPRRRQATVSQDQARTALRPRRPVRGHPRVGDIASMKQSGRFRMLVVTQQKPNVERAVRYLDQDSAKPISTPAPPWNAQARVHIAGLWRVLEIAGFSRKIRAASA